MRRYFLYGIFALLLVSARTSAQTGSTGLSFLKLGVGGRALAMGEAYSALASDPAATYYNPSALSLVTSPQIMLMHKEWIQGTKTEFLGAATNSGDFSFGIGVNATSVGDIEVRNVPGPPITTFTARNASIGVSGSYKLDSNFAVGVTGKLLYEEILESSASGYAADLGALYNTPWNLRLAFAVNNLGSMNDLDKQASVLPVTVRIGGAYEIPVESLEGVLTLASDIVSLSSESKTHFHLGSEFDYKRLFMIRAGYQTDYETKGFSAGIGFRANPISLDYAFVPFKYDLGSAHTISLSFVFP